MNVGIDKDLEVLVGWSRFALIPGQGNGFDSNERHSAKDTLTFLVNFSDFTLDKDKGTKVLEPVASVPIDVEILIAPQQTKIKDAVVSKSVPADTMKKLIYKAATGFDPTKEELKETRLDDGVTYTFHPQFRLEHASGPLCGLEGFTKDYPNKDLTAEKGHSILQGPISANP